MFYILFSFQLYLLVKLRLCTLSVESKRNNKKTKKTKKKKNKKKTFWFVFLGSAGGGSKNKAEQKHTESEWNCICGNKKKINSHTSFQSQCPWYSE